MPLDDLDDFLAMELGTSTKQPKTSQQVNSLEALVLSRVQETCPPEERYEAKTPSPSNTTLKPNIDPIFELVDLLIPLINKLQTFLYNPEMLVDRENLSNERSLLAEQLLALPEMDFIDKSGIFAAIASCIDAVNSTKTEKRYIAKIRLQNLSQALISAKEQAQEEKLKALNSFLQHFN
ncbi:MAG: hypothetical protein HY819_23075 [Acidobacteria bacterium]|nr:hypothetical protein [Acidobacteriota bacterium]